MMSNFPTTDQKNKDLYGLRMFYEGSLKLLHRLVSGPSSVSYAMDVFDEKGNGIKGFAALK